DQPANVGLFVSSEETKTAGEVIDMLLGGAGAWAVVDFVGKFLLAVLVEPTGDADDVLTDMDIYGEPLIDKTTVIPPWAVRVGYGRVWAVQPADSLAGAVTPANRLLYSNQYRYERSSLTTILTKHKFSKQLEVE